MGSGKTSVGKVLAENLNLPFIDLDAYIENAEQKTITEIFATEGQIRFRKKEHEHLNVLLNESQSVVLATGGGAPCYSGNMQTIIEATKNVFYLRISISELVKRLAPEKALRPLIARLSEEEMPEFFGKHLFERSGYYAQASHTIGCDGKSVKEISAEIERLLV